MLVVSNFWAGDALSEQRAAYKHKLLFARIRQAPLFYMDSVWARFISVYSVRFF